MIMADADCHFLVAQRSVSQPLDDDCHLLVGAEHRTDPNTHQKMAV
jgi:hypothetical protein